MLGLPSSQCQICDVPQSPCSTLLHAQTGSYIQHEDKREADFSFLCSSHTFFSVHELPCIPANPQLTRLKWNHVRFGHTAPPSSHPTATRKPCRIPNSFVRGKRHLIRAHVQGSIWLGAAVRRLPELSWRPGGSARSWRAGARGQLRALTGSRWAGTAAPLPCTPARISWSLYEPFSSALEPPAPTKETELNLPAFHHRSPRAVHPSHLCLGM